MNHEESFRKEMQNSGYKEDLALEKEILFSVGKLPRLLGLFAVLSILIALFRGLAGHTGDDMLMRVFALLFVLSLALMFFCHSFLIKKTCIAKNLSTKKIAIGGSSKATAFIDSTNFRFALILCWTL